MRGAFPVKKKTITKKTPSKKKTVAKIKTVGTKTIKPKDASMSKDLLDIEKKIKIIVSEILGVPQKKITRKAHFINDLGMDSMKALEILAALERLFNVQVDEENLQNMINLEKIMIMVEELLSKKKNKTKKKKTK